MKCRLNDILKERYDIDLLANLDYDHLQYVFSHYMDKRTSIYKMLGESTIPETPQYTKAYLISEAARMILREIAPKRMHGRNKKGAK